MATFPHLLSYFWNLVPVYGHHCIGVHPHLQSFELVHQGVSSLLLAVDYPHPSKWLYLYLSYGDTSTDKNKITNSWNTRQIQRLAPKLFWKTVWCLRRGRQELAHCSVGGELLTSTEEIIGAKNATRLSSMLLMCISLRKQSWGTWWWVVPSQGQR